MTVLELRNKLERRKGKKEQIELAIIKAQERMEEGGKSLRRHEKAREVIKQVGLRTQEQLSYNVADITSMALNAVMDDDPYELELQFVERRNKTECDISFTREGDEIDTDDAGGGARDVAAFALRVASWSMQTPRSRNTLILDEPFKHLKGEKANRLALDMIHEVSKKLGIQIIMVSDERVSREATVAATDKLFEVTKKNKVSQINIVE